MASLADIDFISDSLLVVMRSSRATWVIGSGRKRAIVRVNLNLMRATPRSMGLARPPMVLAQPKGSSVRLRFSWLIA